MSTIYTQKQFNVNNFDLLRLIAATQVIIDHYFQHLNIPIGNLGLQFLYLLPGVSVFFIISGYLISASYERNNNLRIYLKNRLFRILPGLWGCIIISIIVISLTGVSFFNKQVLTWLPTQLFGIIYTPGFLNNYGFGSYNGSLWTIPIELQFYLLLPTLFFVLPKKRFYYWLAGLILIFVLFNIIYQLTNFKPVAEKLIGYSFIPHFYLFLTGVLLQKLRIYNWFYIYNKAQYWIIAYIAFCFSPFHYINPAVFLVIKNLILAVTVLSIAYTMPHLSAQLLRTNDISYGVYIYHGLILTVVVQQKWVGYINVFYVIFLAYFLGFLSWKFIEKPLLKKKEKTIRAVD